MLNWAFFWASAAVLVLVLLRKIIPNTTAMMTGTDSVPIQKRTLVTVRTNSKLMTVPRLCCAMARHPALRLRARERTTAAGCGPRTRG
ncbi:hypothetical protein D9M72_428440 [compost metagenome]